VKAVATGDDVALENCQLSVVAIPNSWRLGFDVAYRDVTCVKVQRLAVGNCRRDQVLDDFMLPVHSDGSTACELGHVDTVIESTEAKKDSAMDESLSAHSLADADLIEQIRGIVLEHTRPCALLAMRATL
jgi:hypothetical protein